MIRLILGLITMSILIMLMFNSSIHVFNVLLIGTLLLLITDTIRVKTKNM